VLITDDVSRTIGLFVAKRWSVNLKQDLKRKIATTSIEWLLASLRHSQKRSGGPVMMVRLTWNRETHYYSLRRDHNAGNR